MQLRDIQYVLAVAAELSFSKAAQKLFISQPALSQSIKRLEQELGSPLFVRENNAVKLTGAGEVFVKNGGEIVAMSARLKQEIRDIGDTREENLRIGISPFYSHYYLPRIIPAFTRQYPAVKLNIAEEHSVVLERLVIEDQVDFCLIPLPIDLAELDCRPIYQEQILFAMPENHPLGNRIARPPTGMPFIDLRLVRYEPFIFLKKVQKFTPMGLRLCREAGFVPNIVFETINWDTVDSLIAAGMGVGFVPEVLVESPSRKSTPRYFRIMAENTTRPYVVAYKKGNSLTASARSFIEIAQKSFQIFV